MIQLLITSSALILVLVLLRLLLRKRISQRLIYGMWLLVALRLLLPVELGQWGYSLASAMEPVTRQVQQVVSQPIAGPDQEALYQQLLQDYISVDPEAAVEPEVLTALRHEAQQKTAPSMGQLLKAVWLIGAAVMSLWLLGTNLLFLHRVRKESVLWERSGAVPVRVCPYVPTPCLVGLFRPAVCIAPENLQDEGQLSHILVHEMTHLRHWDPLWALVRCLCLCLYWFHPLVWVAALLSKRDCELACDEAALERLGTEARISYGKTLLAVVTHARSPAHILEMATAMSESKDQLKERLGFIVKKPKIMLTATALLVLIAVLATGCSFLGAAAEEIPTDSTHAEETVPVDSVVDEAVQALAVATDLIEGYNRFLAHGICCEYAYLQADLSQYMTEKQKEMDGAPYNGNQLQILCCHTPEEARDHVLRTLSDSLIGENWAGDMLFTDGQGNLYRPYHGMGAFRYHGIRLAAWSSDRIVALADGSDEGGYVWSKAFLLTAKEGRWFLEDSFTFATATEDMPDWWG